jgi:hypothetical protein
MSDVDLELLPYPKIEDWIEGFDSRDSILAFIHHYYRRVKEGEDIPAWWHQVAATILICAADAIEADPSKATGPVVKAMGLQAMPVGGAHVRRDEAICITIQQLRDKGMSAAKAQVEVAGRMSMGAGTIKRKIWGERDENYVESYAEHKPDSDFLAWLYPVKK